MSRQTKYNADGAKLICRTSGEFVKPNEVAVSALLRGYDKQLSSNGSEYTAVVGEKVQNLQNQPSQMPYRRENPRQL